jgi:hypothetical protein
LLAALLNLLLVMAQLVAVAVQVRLAGLRRPLPCRAVLAASALYGQAALVHIMAVAVAVAQVRPALVALVV